MSDNFSLLDIPSLYLKEASWLPYVTPIFLEGVMHQWWKKCGVNVYETLEDVVAETKVKHQKEKVNLVGHSLGGIEALAYTLNNPDDIDNCIPVAAPVSGTNVAHSGLISLAFGFDLPSARDLLPSSNYIKTMEYKIRNNMPEMEEKGVKITNIWSPVDELVADGGCSIRKVLGRDSPALDEYKFFIGHCGIFYNDDTIKIVKDMIQDSEYPTILLHGLSMNKRFFDMFKNDLDSNLRNKVKAISYDFTLPLKI